MSFSKLLDVWGKEQQLFVKFLKKLVKHINFEGTSARWSNKKHAKIYYFNFLMGIIALQVSFYSIQEENNETLHYYTILG